MATEIPNLLGNFNKFLKGAQKQAELAVLDWIENDMRSLSDKYVPEKYGYLKDSFFVEDLKSLADNFLRKRIGYGKNLSGGTKFNYAAELHEVPKNNYTKSGSGPRYLERALLETKGKLLPKVATYIRKIR